MIKTDFHFSPRANRANEIDWMPWSADAFARAEREDKPILLSISAVWCHWCHVMDETSYSDESVIAAINERFVPVRVDNDERPDVNARYNMGGWPTTAFLAPDGTTLTGATYLPPAQMRKALDEIASFYAESKTDIQARAAELRGRRKSYEPATRSDLNEGMIATVRDALTSAYDEEFGGFGDAPKFPQPEALEFLLAEWRATNDPHLYEIVARTMREMSLGGMYDHIEGGFFRYSTTRDWSVPHFEKMSEDHAGLLRVLAQLLIWTPTPETRATLRSALNYVRTTLRDPNTQFFAGSQDADERYFAMPLDERKRVPAPFVDHRSYTNWTAALAGAFAWAATALDDVDVFGREAIATLDAIHERLHDDDGMVYHVAAPGEAPRIRGLLADHVAYLRALLDAHEHLGETRFLDRAVAIAQTLRTHFEAADGGFYDRADREETIGRLDVSDRPIVDNGLAAESLLRLAALTGDDGYRSAAERVLALYARTFAGAGSFGSTYARALRRYLDRAVTVKAIGTLEETAEFREASRRLPSPNVCVRSIPPADAAGAGFPDVHPAAYVCVGTSCSTPIRTAAELRVAYDTVT